MMYQNYLITGATGFLGSAVVQLLLAHGCRFLTLGQYLRSEEHTSELQSRVDISYAVFCLKKRYVW